MVLNDKNNLGLTLTWTTIGAIVTDDRAAPPKPTVADAFKGTPTKELLPAGTLLYKFNDGPLIRPQRFGGDPPPPDMKMSPWWSAVLPYKFGSGLDQRLAMARLLGISVRELARLTSVVKEDWSSLSAILTIALKQPVYGWFGEFKGMSRIGSGASKRDAVEGSLNAKITLKSGAEKTVTSKNLPGGATQFYIPNLIYGAHVASATITNI